MFQRMFYMLDDAIQFHHGEEQRLDGRTFDERCDKCSSECTHETWITIRSFRLVASVANHSCVLALRLHLRIPNATVAGNHRWALVMARTNTFTPPIL